MMIQRVVWSEGTFVGPQHFQQMERYHEELLAARFAALSPFTWGVVRRSIDEAALRAGVFKLDALVGVLPDGLPVALAAAEGRGAASRRIEELLPASGRALGVYIAVAREREGVDNYAAVDEPRRMCRYLTFERSIPDLTCAERSAPTAVARPHVQVLVDGEPHDDFAAIKIAEVVRGPGGAPVLDHSYIPPCFQIDAAPAIQSGLLAVVKLLAARRAELASAVATSERPGLGVDAVAARHVQQLAAVSACFELFKTMAEFGGDAPRTVYTALVQAAGWLGAFASEPAELLPFVYTDLRASFTGVFGRLHALLATPLQSRCLEVGLTRGSNKIWHAEVGQNVLGCKQFVIGVRGVLLPPQDMWKEIAEQTKVASDVDIGKLVNFAVMGVPVEVLPQPPPEVPSRKDTTYLLLHTQKSHHWAKIAQEGKIAVFPAEKFRDAAQFELFAVPQAAP